MRRFSPNFVSVYLKAVLNLEDGQDYFADEVTEDHREADTDEGNANNAVAREIDCSPCHRPNQLLLKSKKQNKEVLSKNS